MPNLEAAVRNSAALRVLYGLAHPEEGKLAEGTKPLAPGELPNQRAVVVLAAGDKTVNIGKRVADLQAPLHHSRVSDAEAKVFAQVGIAVRRGKIVRPGTDGPDEVRPSVSGAAQMVAPSAVPSDGMDVLTPGDVADWLRSLSPDTHGVMEAQVVHSLESLARDPAKSAFLRSPGAAPTPSHAPAGTAPPPTHPQNPPHHGTRPQGTPHR
ncbi:hypothetical protein [Streptomyces globisporus]|uniref:hypothetical protein n=1 Tax=Streptomyces globisporus TaxID=1908 RepID=UPI0038208C12